MRASS
jgi:hypothetical protein